MSDPHSLTYVHLLRQAESRYTVCCPSSDGLEGSSYRPNRLSSDGLESLSCKPRSAVCGPRSILRFAVRGLASLTIPLLYPPFPEGSLCARNHLLQEGYNQLVRLSEKIPSSLLLRSVWRCHVAQVAFDYP
jgi:hypothetical protein